MMFPFLARPFRALALALLAAWPVGAQNPKPLAAPSGTHIEGVPAATHRTLAEVFQDPHWHQPRPGLSRFPLRGAGQPLSGITALAFLDCPELPEMHRHWAVADATGIHLVNARGEVRRLFGMEEDKAETGAAGPACLALAVRPAGSAQDHPFPLVWARRDPVAAPDSGVSCSVHALGRDGRARFLAGGVLAGSAIYPNQDSMAQFQDIRALAMDGRGRVFVADAGRQTVSIIALDGRVAHLAGDHQGYGARDGQGAKAVFGYLNGMVLDPGTGCLYVTDRHALRRVAPGGAVSTLIGRLDNYARSFHALQHVPSRDSACLNYPRGMELRGQHLYLADTRNCAIRVFDLERGTLSTLAGHPEQKETREGPLSHFSPALDASQCAALQYPLGLACNPEGVCLVAFDDGLAELEFPLFEAPAREGQPEPASGPCCVIL